MLKPQTVYIKKGNPSNSKNQVIISEWQKESSDYIFSSFATIKENHYCLSEEELIGLLNDVHDAGQRLGWNECEYHNCDSPKGTEPTKEQFINQLFSKQH